MALSPTGMARGVCDRDGHLETTLWLAVAFVVYKIVCVRGAVLFQSLSGLRKRLYRLKFRSQRYPM